MAAPETPEDLPGDSPELVEQRIDAVVAVLPPLLQALDALTHVGRHLHPARLRDLVAGLKSVESELAAALEDFRGISWPPQSAALVQPIEAAAEQVGQSFAGLAAADHPEGLMQAYRALRFAPRAAEALYPLAGHLGPVSMFFLDQAGRADEELRQRLAAAGIGRLRDRTPDPVAGAFESPLGVELEFDPETAAACPYFVGRYIRGVKNGPSPAWLQQRLKAIGLRPISALVDMTNYITFDRSRPLHVFDPDQVAGKIRVRLARAGEVVEALNDKSYTLDDQVTVIADDNGAHALGGVIGGVSTGCTEDTTNVFIEAALFDPVRTAATGRRYQIESDARYRFERGLDPAAVVEGIEAATLLVLELCGGEASELVIAGAEPAWRKNVTLRPERIKALGGIEISPEAIAEILESLGFGVTSEGDVFSVAVPSWRSDVDGEADLVEEVTRIYGYHRVPAVPLDTGGRVTHPALAPVQRRGPWATRALAARGLQEVVTWSFTAAAWLDLFGGVRDDLRLANPISSELDVMRPSLLPNLIVAAGRNVDRGAQDLGLFEVGPSWRDPTPEGQDRVAAGLRRGRSGARHWLEAPREVDAFDAKADAMAALQAAGAPVASLQVAGEAPPWYHPGRSGTLRLGPKSILAAFGEVHPRVLDRLGVKGPMVAFEANLSALPAPRAKASRTRPVLDSSDLPFVDRDFAFVVGADEPAGNLVRAARGADKALIVDVSVFDVFEGPALGADRKSIAIRVRLQPRKQTLTEAEIEATSQKIVAAVTKASGGELRT